MRQDEIWEERPGGQAERTDDERNQFDTDYARIVHCAAFRRLQSKTQTLNLGDGDFYRTRLTHSLEVAQIAGGIVKSLAENRQRIDAETLCRLLPDHSLIQAISLAHDLGHPPFGHGGEVALNYCMRDNGGFEGNGQTFRILSKLETFAAPYSDTPPLPVRHSNGLTRRTLLGVLKYPVPYQSAVEHKLRAGRYPQLNKNLETVNAVVRAMSKPPKCYLDSEADEVNWVLKPLSPGGRETFAATDENGATLYKSFDCSIMDIADDIAYGVHDLEDAIVHDLISKDRFRERIPEDKYLPFAEEAKRRLSKAESGGASCDSYTSCVEGLFGAGGERENKVHRKRCIGSLIHCFLASMDIEESTGFSKEHSLFRYKVRLNRESREFLDSLQDLIMEEVIRSPRVQHLEFKGQQMVVAVFEALQSDPKSLLTPDAFERYDESGEGVRAICDYVAGMTDNYLLKTYERLFSPRMGSIFDKL